MCSLLLDEFDKTLDRPVTRVFNRIRFLSGRVQFDGGEPADVIGNVVEGGITLGNNDFVGMTGICNGKLFVFWSKVFAVSTLFCQSN